MTKAIESKYYELQDYKEKLTKEELLFFKKALEEKKIKIEKNLALTEKEFSQNDADCPKDECDHAAISVNNSANTAVIREQNKTLNQINRCLYKVESGRYGICNMCEEVIDIERLKVKIFAEYCISCREIIEKQ